MKNIVLTSILSITLLSSCSWIMGKDKNELQPNLAAAPRVPVNQDLNFGQPTMIGMDQPAGFGAAPMMPNEMAMMAGSPDINSLQPAAVQVIDQAPMQNQIPAIQMPVMPIPNTPMMAATQAPVPTFATLPPQVTGNSEPTVIATISKNRKLPASLLPAYNNPLNSESAFAPAPMIMQQQPVMAAPQIQSQQMQPMMMTQPIYAPTMPVDQMQMSPQPVQLN